MLESIQSSLIPEESFIPPYTMRGLSIDLSLVCETNKIAIHPFYMLNYARPYRHSVVPCAFAHARRFSSNKSNKSFDWVCVSHSPRRVCTSSRKTYPSALTYARQRFKKGQRWMARHTRARSRVLVDEPRGFLAPRRAAHILCTSVFLSVPVHRSAGLHHPKWTDVVV